eukprot:2246099-Prymnesium_polylepis.1
MLDLDRRAVCSSSEPITLPTTLPALSAAQQSVWVEPSGRPSSRSCCVIWTERVSRVTPTTTWASVVRKHSAHSQPYVGAS